MDACEVGRALSFDFHLALKSDLTTMETALKRLMDLIRRLPCAAGDLDDVELALREAIANSIVQGNRQDP